ncbi:hypothetical protein JCM17845_06600 [Iodidimonas gelatinilytica]|uniref:Uncharacterized protein n=1 Tax=Iodidimonas gelatinilytica TaxID=1236966 RepID=A0A5A7MW31_9PROT|nr:hypothetical protein [Iodidimonas gelatinilytica]GER00037.1 hypothetical protein JCM17845_06600 [Iodidimonas gelatinilytica]
MGKALHSGQMNTRISYLRYGLIVVFVVLSAVIFTVWTVHSTYRDAHVRMRYDMAATASSITHGLRALELVISTVAEHVAASAERRTGNPIFKPLWRVYRKCAPSPSSVPMG